ncbi:MAG TPA: HD domain-containing phosphohydrolase [Casimicrobiaceae bacterium]|nr:HD domain-containing phosphohydrolase [Casimicrobiaceae bacterium]
MPPLPTDELVARFEQLTDVGRALARERDPKSLLDIIVAAAMRLTRADGGALYRLDAEARALSFDIVRNRTLRWGLEGVPTPGLALPRVALALDDGGPNHGAVVAHAALTRRSVRIADVYDVAGFDFAAAKRFDAQFGYRTRSLLAVPMQDHRDELIGVLQLVNAQDAHGAQAEFSDADERLAEALTGLAGVVLSNQLLIGQLEALFESLVALINTAIDEKSPHTHGHCQRVPELTMMLAEAAHETAAGPLAPFRMTERDRAELHLAGMLHDCGKITTPVHVVDKATKLQTIVDRIELVAARFDALAADARRRALERKLAGADAAATDAALEAELAAIAADLAFLRRANVGEEKMAAADVERVRRIAERRYAGPDGEARPVLTEDELANLTIRSGTLTPAERAIINRHIESTIAMLESLPWPRHLARVPEYAGGHHERMDGKGYPRGLTREQMSWQARMMGIADVFEALTAPDRPYKIGKPLSESLAILGRMCVNGHVDPDLFDVFVRRKVYLDYARKFMDPAQIDAVDERAIPGYRP